MQNPGLRANFRLGAQKRSDYNDYNDYNVLFTLIRGLWQFGVHPIRPHPLLAYAKPRVAPDSYRYPSNLPLSLRIDVVPGHNINLVAQR